MRCLLLLCVVVTFINVVCSQVRADKIAVLDQLEWQEAVQDVNRTSSLAQVLKEFLDDIETVEAAASLCAAGHRDTYWRGELTLQTELGQCESSSRRQKDMLARCVEDKTRSAVSDVRQHITKLKNCVDRS